MNQRATVVFIIATIIAITGYDFFALFYWGSSATISDTVRNWSGRFTLLPGLVAGGMIILWYHLFIQKNKGP
jgi:hypothetical protein